MKPLDVVDAIAAPLLRPDINTDVIIRIDRLIDNPADSLGTFLFESWRYLPDGRPDPAFELNHDRYAHAEILVAGENFGCGSSREHAVWALEAYGIRVLIAPSFGDIFHQNCFQNGMLPITLASDEVARIAAEIESADRPRMRVDLNASVVITPAGRTVEFEIDAERRAALLAGRDDIDITLIQEERLSAFERRDAGLRPWIYRTTDRTQPVQLLMLGGDGVGAEVVAEVRRIIEWFVTQGSVNVDVSEEQFGIAAWRAHGTLMRDETWQRILAADAIIFGAIGTPQYDEIPAEHRQVDWLLEMRRTLDLYENLRPIRALEPLLDSSPLRPDVVKGVDMVIVRELAGGIYFNSPRGIETLDDGTHRAVNTTAYTTAEVHRIARAAFELARTRNGRVCSVDKANVLEVGAFWRQTVQTLRDAEFPDVELSHMYVDNCAMQLVREPRQFDVILTDNLFGDILSDCAAMVTGSLGMLPSASLGPVRPDGRRTALYEPIHGSAPDIAGQGIANPLGAISSFGLCLRHTLNAVQQAALLERAIEQALEHGARTRDLTPGDEPRALTTSEMTDAVIAELDTFTNMAARRR